MIFKSKTEAYSYVILLLTQICNKHVIKAEPSDEETRRIEALEKVICHIKILMENHEQNPLVIIDLLRDVTELLSPEDEFIVTQVQHDLLESAYKQTPQEKFENPLARRAESELGIILLQNPTKAMMHTVGRVSAEIIQLIKDNYWDVQQAICSTFPEYTHPIALGAPKYAPTVESVMTTLRNNDPKQLIEILYIHFKFAQSITRESAIRHAPAREPVGELAQIIKKIYPGKPVDFFKRGLAIEFEEGDYFRSYISNVAMYGSPLYKAIPDRGRGSVFDPRRTHQLGLMLWGQSEYEINLPKHTSAWAADCKSQSPNLRSQHVIDLIENDTVYVAGPSGMASMLLGQMEILANFEDESLKKNYLSAVAAYIVGGGFHSLHEVIGPAEDALHLVPGYLIRIPRVGELAPPPNYYQFFHQQSRIDPEFSDRRKQAWDNYLKYLNNDYEPAQRRTLCYRFDEFLERLNQSIIRLEEKDPTTDDTRKPISYAKALHDHLKKLGDKYFSQPASTESRRRFTAACRREVELAREQLLITPVWERILRDIEALIEDLFTLVFNSQTKVEVSEKRAGRSGFFKATYCDFEDKISQLQKELDELLLDGPIEKSSVLIECKS